MSQDTRAHVVLLSYHTFFAEGMNAAFTTSADFKLAATFRDADTMFRYFSSSEVDIAVIDMAPDITLTMLRSLRRTRQVPIVLWGAVSAQFAYHALELGVRGIIPEDATAETFYMAMKAVRAGQLWISQDIIETVMRAKRIALTRREGELIVLLAQGLKNKELAYSLGISEGTVKVYLSRLFKKLNVNDRFELALYALKNLVPGLHGDLGLKHEPAGQQMSSDLHCLNSILLKDGEREHAPAPDQRKWQNLIV